MSPHRKIAASLAILVVVLAVILAVALGQRSVRRGIALLNSPVGPAQWIWAPKIGEREGPLAFYAVRDFELEGAPTAARLLCLADETYVAYLNGELVGSGRYRSRAPLDAYDVTSLARPGRNRLTFELRSSRGVGALLASLEVDGTVSRREIVTDGDWRVFWRYRSGIFALEPLEGGATVRIWGPPPAGRWQTPPSVRDLPLNSELVTDSPVVKPKRVWYWDRKWFRVRSRAGRPVRPVDSMLMFEWMPPLTGYLNVHQRTNDARDALLFVGLEVPTPDESAPDAHLVLVPGRSGWRDALPREIRFAVVVGVDEPLAAVIQAVDPTLAPELLRQGGQAGVFGLEPPLLRTPMEDEVWRHVEGLPSETGREER